MRILGVSAFYHDSAAALIEDGQVIAAAQEERFTRKKHDAGFPGGAISYCLEEAGISLKDVGFVAFYDKPFLKFERLLETYLSYAPKGFTSFKMAMPIWLKEKLFQKDLLRKQFKTYDPEFDWMNKLLFSEHHFSHAASAFFPSPYENACVLTMDGVGEWATTSVALGQGNKLEMIKEIHFPHSLGLLYSAMTYYTGFKVNSGEYKVMGLAPYGEPKYAQLIFDNLIDIKEDGSFRLDQRYFDYCTGLTMTNPAFDGLFGGPPRRSEELLTQRHMDLAASVQAVTEEVVLKITRALATKTGQKNLCLAGGVALNCVANGQLLREGPFQKIWIQPAAGDAGGALGAALAASHMRFGIPRPLPNGDEDSQQGSYLGPAYSDTEIAAFLNRYEYPHEVIKDDTRRAERIAQHIADGNIVGFFSGRMEFGPRALGGRSIIGDARSPIMQSVMNLKVKFRESFRPFAPSCLLEDVTEFFELDEASPYMLLVAPVVESRRRQIDAS